MSAFPKSCDFIILFPFQDSAPPPHKRPREEEEDEDAISIFLNEEEEGVNLVSPLLKSKVTISVLNIYLGIDFLTKSLLF